MEKTKILITVTEKDAQLLTDYAKEHGVSRNAVIVNAIHTFTDSITNKEKMLDVLEEALRNTLTQIQAAKNE